MNRIRIIHMLCSNSYSGAENVVCQIINTFKGDERYEFVYASPDGPIRDALKERDVNFVPMTAATLGEFKRVIRKVKPDIVHAHDMRAGFFASLACGNIPLVSHIHNNNFDSQGFSLKSVMYYFTAQKVREEKQRPIQCDRFGCGLQEGLRRRKRICLRYRICG